MANMFDFMGYAKTRNDKIKEQSTYSDPYQEFLNELIDYGMDISVVDDSGKIQRCHSTEGTKKGKPCWYRFTVINNIGFGTYGDFRRDETINFIGTRYNTLAPEERRTLDQKRDIIRKTNEAEDLENKRKAKEKAQKVINNADDVPETYAHPYLEKKKVKAYGIKKINDMLYIPVWIKDEITSYQAIYPDGNKKFCPFGEIKGGYHFIQGTSGKLYFVEGYATGATVHQATKASVMVCFNSHNLINVIEYYRTIEKEQNIIIAADNDWQNENKEINKRKIGNAGLKAAKECQAKFNNVSFIYPKNLQGSDFNDLAEEKGIDAVREALGFGGGKMKIVQVDQLKPQSEHWIIKKLIPKRNLGMVFGASGHMKSFVTLDMALHLCAGFDNFHGLKIKGENHRVLYICGEGSLGVKNRVTAWKKHYNITKPLPFYMTTTPVLMLEKDQTSLMLRELNDFMFDNSIEQYPTIIIVDTLNRNFGAGDENNTKDMTSFIGAIDELSEITGSTFLIVHHSNRTDNNQARGNASLKNACDFEYQVNMENYLSVKDGYEHPKILLTCTKMKDYAMPKPMQFSPKEIILGKDEDEDDITSVVMLPNQEDKTPEKRMVSDANLARENLKQSFIDVAKKMSEEGLLNLSSPVLTYEAVRIRFKSLCNEYDMSEASIRKSFQRASQWAAKEKLINQCGKEGDYVVLDKYIINKATRNTLLQ
jgi:phage/plasmid primase-like uncharacterized protein